MNFFQDIIDSLNPFKKKEEQTNKTSTPVSLLDVKPEMIFKVGEGLSPEQAKKAQETVTKPVEQPPVNHMNFFSDIVDVGKKVANVAKKTGEAISSLNQPSQQQGMTFEVGNVPGATPESKNKAQIQFNDRVEQLNLSEEKFKKDQSGYLIHGPNPESTVNFFKEIAQLPARVGISVSPDVAGGNEYVPSTPLEKFFLGSEPIKGIAVKVADVEQTVNDLSKNLEKNPNSLLAKTAAKLSNSNVNFLGTDIHGSTGLGFALVATDAFLSVYPGGEGAGKVEKEAMQFITKRLAEGIADDVVLRQVEKQFGKEIADKAATAMTRLQKVSTPEELNALRELTQEDLIRAKSIKPVAKDESFQTVFRGEDLSRGKRLEGGIIKGQTEFGDAPFVSFTDNPELAKQFGDTVGEHKVNMSKILDLDSSTDAAALKILKGEIDPSLEQVAKLKKAGYDGISFNNLEDTFDGQRIGGKEIRVFGDFNTKTAGVRSLDSTGGFKFDLTQEEATKKLRTLFDDTEVRFLVRNDLIRGQNAGQFTPNAPISVFSNISRPLIEVVQHEGKISSEVLYHESFHAYLNTFVDEATRLDLIDKTKKNFLARLSQELENKKAYKTAELRAEEWLANDFAKFVAGKEFEAQSNRNVYQRILDKIRGWIRKSTGAAKIYEDILGRVRPGGEVTPGVGEKAFNATEYVKQMTQAREEARGKEPTFKDKFAGFYRTVKAKLVDANSPIEDVLRAAEKESQFKVLPKADITNAIDRVYRAPVMAGQFAKDNGLVDVIQKVDNLDNLEQYMIAKHAQTLEEAGIKTGRDLEADKLLIKEFAPKYDEFAKKVTGYSRKLLDYSVESGLISRELADKLIATYPDYVPMNRVFDETEKAAQGQFNTRAVASLSKQTVVQKIQGSEREIESPIASLLKKTTDAFVQGEKNKAAGILASYKELPKNPFDITPLRTYENVTERISLFSEAKELKPVERKIESMVSKSESQLKTLQREINKNEKLGLAAALRSPEKELKLTGRQTDVKKMIEQMITDPNSDVVALKKKIATRENKLGPLLDQIEEAKQMYEDIHTYRMGLKDEARLLADAKSKGLDTFAVLKNGVKEIYATRPEIAAAAKQLNVQQLNILGRIFAMPVRLAKLGITGINLPFVGANVARDQVFTMITSEKALKTSIANPAVFLDSLFAAVKHNELYGDLVRAGAGGTSFDIARNALPETIERIRAGRSLKSKIAYTVKNPSQLLRTVEDIVGRGEELTRLQQFEGTRKALLGEGRSMADATIEAAKAARQNSANFARHGEWGPVLNSAFLYLNASIQGSRTLIQALAKRPVQTASKIATVFLAPLAAITAWNLSDPERRKAYLDIARYEKDNNLVIVPPNPTQDDKGRWNVIKIPITPGLSNIGIPVRRTIEWAYGTQKPEVWNDIAAPLIGTVSPIAPDAGSIASSLTPQAIRPSLEALTNRSFFTGKQQVPDSMKDLSPELQAKPYTSGTARKIAGAIGASPIKTEEFIRGTFGGVGSQTLNLMDQALAGFNIIPDSQVGGQNLIEGITARFSKAYGGSSDDESVAEIKKILTDQADDRFKTKQAAEALYEELKSLPKDEANAKAKELKKVNPDLYDQLKTTIEDDKKGLTYEDRLIKQIGVENGQRALFIWEKTKSFKTKEEKNNYINELKRKGVISDTVMEQLKQLAKKGK